jgi:hypothetical protein
VVNLPIGSSEREAFLNALKDKRKEETKALTSTYHIHVEPFGVTAESWTPIQFTFDGERRAMTIEPRIASGNMGDYPDKLSTTSELLAYVAAVLSVDLSLMDWNLVRRNVSLARLMAAILDHKFELKNIRVAVDDPEEWDYMNPGFDLEAGLYCATK